MSVITRLGDLYFSQDSISPTFSNGDRVDEMIHDLATGKEKLSGIKTVRVVVSKNGRFTALDNRRLYAFQQCPRFNDNTRIKVQVHREGDPAIAKERARKPRSNPDIKMRSGDTPPMASTATPRRGSQKKHH